jgi:type IV secretory pathway component VirB8
MIMNQSSTKDEPSPQVQNLNIQSETMLHQTVCLIEKARNLVSLKKEVLRKWHFTILLRYMGWR